MAEFHDRQSEQVISNAIRVCLSFPGISAECSSFTQSGMYTCIIAKHNAATLWFRRATVLLLIPTLDGMFFF